jgi:nucleoside-diphosphate-sugar epimerase
MRVLIIGAGYVGLPLATRLSGDGHQVFALKRNASSTEELRKNGITPVIADITRGDELVSLTEGCDWVVNCVSSSGGTAADYQAVYLEGNRNILARLSVSSPAKFVFTSSTSVYGQTDGSEVTESSPTIPSAETAKILVKAEELLLETHRASGFPAVILRLAGIYGPGRGYWFKQFVNGEAKVEGSGERFLNMIHRDDVVGAVIAALERANSGEVYNVCDDEPVRQRDLFEWLSQKLGRPMPSSMPFEPDASRKRGITNKRVSNQKLRNDLGYSLKYPTFREGFEAL